MKRSQPNETLPTLQSIPRFRSPSRRSRLLAVLLALVLLNFSLCAQVANETETPENVGAIREKSLKLLHDLVPASNLGRGRKVVESAGGLVYWGNLFDPREVAALVNLAPEKPAAQGDDFGEEETWIRHLSLCTWEKDHWEFRQYLDNARNVEFHDRKDKPHHFVQASRETGPHDGDFLSWYYHPKTKRLVRTHFETWGPFHLLGNYLCTERGFERRAVDETTSVYSYKDGKKGSLLGIYDSDIGSGHVQNFAITFRDQKTAKYWTYSFSPKESKSPYLHYTVDAVEGEPDQPKDKAKTLVHRHAKIELSEEDSYDEYFFERLTGLNRALLNHEMGGDAQWKDSQPKMPWLKKIKFKASGDPDVVRQLNR